MARPWIWLLGSLIFLLILASPARQIDVNGLDSSVFPSGVESVLGVRALTDAFGGNSFSPVQIVVQTEKNGVWKPEFLAAIEQLTNAAAADPHAGQVQSLFTLSQAFRVPQQQYQTLTPEFFKGDPARAAAASQYVNLSGDNNEAVVSIVSKYGQFTNEQQDFIHDLRTKTIPGIRQLRVYEVFVGGTSASFVDSKQALYGRFPLLVAAVLALTYLILLMFFQSVFLPLKAIILNAVSVLATYGVLVALFQWGWASKPLGFETVGKLGLMTPAILFVILFGLSTDYEVFLLSRVKEYFHQTHNNEEAVATGLEHTAGVITAAGLILIGVFGSFGAAGILSLKEVGIGLAVGVLLDSTIVRMIMVPATMRLTGNLNWWMPGWLRAIIPELREGPMPEPALAAGAAGSSASGTGLSGSTGSASLLPPQALSPARLRPIGNSIGIASIPLTGTEPLRIGRSRENELQLFDPHVSRHHARVEYSNGLYRLVDLNSSNGVYVNGQRIPPPPVRPPLRNGDVIQIGDDGSLTFVFEQGSGAASAGATVGS